MPHSRRTERLDCDVLVLGAGLAGQRAAWAAAETVPGLRILIVSPVKTPSGSSFANRNDALGLQVPGPDQADEFMEEVLALAGPAAVRLDLVRAMADDAPMRLTELLSLNLAFRRDAAGGLMRFPGCFSAVPRAVIFDGLAKAHAAFRAKVRSLGAEFLHGYAAIGLDRDAAGRVCGAQLLALRSSPNREDRLDIRAKTVVAALGGPAALYATHICGPGGTGLSYGLLAEAGAEIVNAPFMQFFWGEAGSLAFVNPGDLPWPDSAEDLAAARRGHCPVASGLPDRQLDLALLARRDAGGLVQVPGRPPIVLAAQAGNGGALIDADGRTAAAGLYACGECAGGMHSADRIGGCMVLAALTFGARAGAAAAREAAGRESHAILATPPAEAGLRPEFLPRLRRSMQLHGLPGPQQKGRESFLTRLRAAVRRNAGREALLARSALAVLGAKTEY